MAKQSNQKLKLLYLLRILFQNTDQTSGLTLTQIISELAKYNISAARKSIYDDIEVLRLFGIDIQVKRDRYVRYYIDKRDFSFSEIKYIMDAIENFNALDLETGSRIVDKIIKRFGVKGREYISFSNAEDSKKSLPKVISSERDKTVALLGDAIALKKTVSFRLFAWNSLKQRILQNEGKRIEVAPLYLEYNEGYILYAFDGEAVDSYAIDRMIDVEILQKNIEMFPMYKNLSDKSFSEVRYEMIRLECENTYAGKIFDRFGLNVTVTSTGDTCFQVSVKVKVNSEFFSWLFINSDWVRLISPDSLIEEYKNKIDNALNNIQKGEA